MDIVAQSLDAIAYSRADAPVLAFVAGVVSSVGPCVAPRIAALAGTVAAARRPVRVTAAFIVGLVAAYASLGLAGGVLGRITGVQSFIFGAVAVAAMIAGCRQLVTARACVHDGGDASRTAPSLGATALLGASFALVISPCCTPIVLAVVAYAASRGPLYGAAMLGAFALGHALPLVVVAAGGVRLRGVLARVVHAQAIGIVGGALMLGLGAYYALLV